VTVENLEAGLRLTVYGMGLVFALLAALAALLALLLRFDRPSPGTPASAAAASAAPAATEPVEARPDEPSSPEVLAAIMIAVRAHIRVRRKQAAPAMRSHQPGTLPSRWVASGRTRQNRSWSPGGRYV
jgi:Na+-transporting methylmalonyl-CoA/oxaloacetate decarboxylase gamma subunit